MAPILRTYGKKQCRPSVIKKDDTFDKLFGTTKTTCNIFESSSEKDKSIADKSVADKSQYFSLNETKGSLSKSPWDPRRVSFMSPNVPGTSKSSSVDVTRRKARSQTNKICKSKLTKKKKVPKFYNKVFEVLQNDDLILISSTPLSFKPTNLLIAADKNISPIDQASPKLPKSSEMKPKNILLTPTSLRSSPFTGLPETPEFFIGFPSMNENVYNSLKSLNETSKKQEESQKESPLEEVSSCSSIDMFEATNQENLPYPLGPLKLLGKISRGAKSVESLSRSMQNLNLLQENKEQDGIVKSSSLDKLKAKQSDELESPMFRVSVHLAHEDLNIDSSDIEESAVNSERSCSGQLGEDESDDDNASAISKDKDSTELNVKRSNSKGDSESAIFSSTNKDTSCNNQSGEVSADDCELYSESEIAKSSDSIEASKAANIENSDLSTSSDRELVKEEDSSTLLSRINFPSSAKVMSWKHEKSKRSSKCHSVKSKDSFYSLDNSGSDDSEPSLESDSELSFDSNRSSRKSSWESQHSNILTRESLEQLRECAASMKIYDEYEDAICKSSRKSLAKRGSDWECPPSPRRSLFPLPENQEDHDEEGEESGSGRRSEDEGWSGSGGGGRREASSGEEDSSGRSPVRDSSPLRRSRRLARRKNTDPRLNMVLEESEVPEGEHIVLPAGKKYRRSLSVLKMLADESITVCPAVAKSLQSIISLQPKLGIESPLRDGRQSLMLRRKSCAPIPESPNLLDRSRASVGIFNSVMAQSSEGLSRKSLKRLSCKVLGEINQTFRKSVMIEVLHEVAEEEEEVTVDEEKVEGDESQVSLAQGTSHDLSFPLEEEDEEEAEEGEEHSLIDFEVDYETLVMISCGQEAPHEFKTILPSEGWVAESRKVGEGVYGEVFLIPREGVKNVIKVIPIQGDTLVNGDKQKTYAEVSNELLITRALSDLKLQDGELNESGGFVDVVKVSVVRGKYPKDLLKLWDDFNEQKGSENDSPKMFKSDQLYLVFELGNAGTDLESYSFSTAKQGLSVFKQTVCALAVAEARYQFEHRDLHWGNVLVARTSEKKIFFTLNGENHSIVSNGVKATIIDFTLSRMTFNKFPIYYDIGQDPDMFIGTGDYQFDIYRAMKEDVKGKWSSFQSKTNVRWLHYLVDKMITKVRYQRRTAKAHNDSIKVLKDIHSWILNCDSAVSVAERLV